MRSSHKVFLISSLLPLAANAAAPNCADRDYDRKSVSERGIKIVKGARHAEDKSPRKPKTQTLQLSVGGSKIPVKVAEFKATQQPSAGTIVFLCGGPGERCVQSGPPQSIPPWYSVVMLDYVGIGENANAAKTSEQMSIDAQGEVVAGVAKGLKLKNYVLFGNSFGTAVATAAAAKLTNDSGNKTKPKALILDGTVSRPLKWGETLHSTAGRAWDLLKPAERTAFENAYDKSVAGFTPEQKASFDLEFFTEPALLGARGLRDAMKALPKDGAKIRQDVLQPTSKKQTSGDLQEMAQASRHFRGPGCQFAESDAAAKPTALFGSRVTIKESNKASSCDCPLIARKFNSADYQVSGIPIVYVSGTTDYITPSSEAKHHADKQKNASSKVMIAVADGGHGEMLSGSMAGCADELFTYAMRSDGERLQKNASKFAQGKCEDPGGAESKPSRAAH